MSLYSQHLLTKIYHDSAFGAIAVEYDNNIQHKGIK